MPLSATEVGALSRLFDQALALPPDALEAWLAALPAEQQALLPYLRRMLQAHAAQTGVAVPSTLPRIPDFDPGDESAWPPDAQAGEHIGPYRLREAIGRGGMGTVWVAERIDGIFEREVALKLPRLSRTPELAQRMARERQIGALLEHPHIARLYDAGIDAAGRPYLVMERVRGTHLLEYCRARRLSHAQCLELMLQLCAAVAHAHRHLVVHRDLKPSNLMVDDDGQVRLLDFGIAKLLDAESGASGTASDAIHGTHTPRYAAPEQVRGGPVTTAADVFSLGVVMFELLTGGLPGPLPGENDRAATLDPDLRAVLRRALQDAPADRYSSVERLADDLRCVLAMRPVSAEPASSRHRIALFGRRHASALSAGALVLLLLIGGAILFARQYAREQALAQRTAQAREFLFDLLEDTEPLQGQTAAQITGIQMLQSALVRARRGFADQPVLRGQVLTELGIMLRRLDQHEDALQVLNEANTLLEGSAAADDPALQVARAQLALALLARGAPGVATRATSLAEAALSGCTMQTTSCAKARAYAHTALMNAASHAGVDTAVLDHARQALRELELAFGPGDVEAAMARLQLAIVLRNAGQFAEAGEVLRPALAIAAQTSMRAADSLQLRIHGALIEADLGRHEPAVLALQTLLREELSAPQRPLIQRLLAQSWFAQGRLQQSLDAASAALDSARREDDEWEAAFAQQARARALSALGRHADAQAAVGELLASLDRQGLPTGALERLRAHRIAGEVALRAGRLEDARRELDPLPAAHRARTGERPLAPVDLAQALDLLGALARREGDLDAAGTRHAEAATLLAGALPEPHPLRRRNALERAWVAALRGAGPNAALAAAAQSYIDVLPADSAWRPMVQSLAADPAGGSQWLL